MTITTSLPVPPGCRRRLVAHYGAAVHRWIDTVPELLTTAAARWSLDLGSYHDAGHASALATATDRNGERLLLKVWPDRDRYFRETKALGLWHRGTDAIVRATDDGLAAAALVMVGEAPGGAARPPQEAGLVAAALQRAHETGRAEGGGTSGFPRLRDYVGSEVLPRVHRRYAASRLGRRACGQALRYTDHLHENPGRHTTLHADLYAENIPFRCDGRPVLLDPLPMSGDAAYDWAFWTVYYRLGQGTGDRLQQACRTSGIPAGELLPWCLLLGLDGLLYYEETEDARVPVMQAVLDDLLERIPRYS
ncbi:hypothetical protein [Streptomyces aidingensis]|uniref:Streptomycin 6-kinase n=1 Tax=Streptomyces aidingensis TaxID=910347 RepID=A0A1I1KVY3_9ACTN|nr:hypothetical protein [Streptomyces aidingensis]SFC61610.1 streptomycin 6-kinase [Streptomyces aidingensis]